MATSHYKGSADILYTPQGGTQQTHLLAIPLLVSAPEGFRSRRRRRYFEAWKDDFTEREVFTIGSEVDEIEARLRMDDDPTGVRSMLREAFDNDVTLIYRPDGSTEYPSLLVSAGGEPGQIVLFPDPDRYGYGEWACNLVLRRVDGGDYEALL